MGTISKKQLENLFLQIDNRLKKEIEIYIIGGCSAILGYNVTKVTNDVDVDGSIDPELQTLFDEEAKNLGLNLYLSSRGVFFPPDDYRSRAEFNDCPKNKLRVWYLNKYDLAISKIDRGLDKDYDDIIRVHNKSAFERETLIKIFNEEYINVVVTGNKREKMMNLIDLILNLFGEEVLEDTKSKINF